jgi:hypothetical protein
MLGECFYPISGPLILEVASSATIPTCENTYVTLHREKMRKYYVEDPLDHMNELVCYAKELGYYNMIATEIAPREDVNIAWKMNFDEAKSITWVDVGIIFVSPKGDTMSCLPFRV